MFMNLRIRAREDFMADAFELLLQDITMPYDVSVMGQRRQVSVVTNMVVTCVDVGALRPTTADSFNIKREQAKELMDDLWNAGVRPSNFRDNNNSGEIAAYKRNLDDLRMVITNLLEIVGRREAVISPGAENA